jgi:hypothetical protein
LRPVIRTPREQGARLRVGVAMREFAFKVNLVAVVRVRAADERIARQVVPEVLGAPGSIEIGLTNQNVRAMGREGSVTGVDFSIGRSSPRNEDAKPRWRR